MLRCVSVAATALALALPASAQAPRNFPATALRGEISFTQPPEVQVNRNPARLAPGARVRGTNNLMLVSGSLAGQRLMVNYTLDKEGQVFEVWVLTPEELARKPWPTTPAEAAAWQFDGVAQTWTRP